MIYCVMGCPRSGTSAVAGCMRIMGIYMGRVEDYTHEDVVMRDGTHEDRVESIRNREQPWGFKDPKAHNYIGNLDAEFRYVIVLRDPEAIARSKIQKSAKAHSADSKHRMRESFADTQKELMRFYYEKEPCLYVSWEKFDVRELADFCGISLTAGMQRKIETFLSGGYAMLENDTISV